MHKSIRRSALLVPVIAALAAHPAEAQQAERAEEVQHRNRCRLAAQVMQTGHPRPQIDWARGYISICDHEGPAVLASEWRVVEGGTAEIYYLVGSSRRIRDARIYDALRSTAADRSRTDVVRVGAMLALAAYVDPRNAIRFSDLRPPRGGPTRIPLVPNWTTAGGQSQGSVPIQGAVAAEVKALFSEIARSRTMEPIEIWYAAAVLAKRVEADIRYGRAR